jgi:xylulose-5-phosphate/fructose-6-phosphate phosphoketolase
MTTDLDRALPAADLVERLARPAPDEVASMDAWWRANNYLTIGQIYLLDNPLLREPLTSDHIEPRLLGH